MKCSADSPSTPQDLPSLTCLRPLLTTSTEILMAEYSLEQSL